MAMHGCNFLAREIKVHHCDGTYTGVIFFAPSIVEGTEPHSICECPDTKNLWLIVLRFGHCDNVYMKQLRTDFCSVLHKSLKNKLLL